MPDLCIRHGLVSREKGLRTGLMEIKVIVKYSYYRKYLLFMELSRDSGAR